MHGATVKTAEDLLVSQEGLSPIELGAY